ncbi:unnamed protein product [Meganyctiphanes norvegica]|uniref:Glycine N-methyltransferase n=1 Tax=Meganyctiphanes norvegica TaxID=48144 RepID=A0AAV2S3C2_MEGNR
MTDNRVYRTRSAGVPGSGIADQYADGTAAQLWELYIGDKDQRTQKYKEFITGVLRENKCKNILDAACGTGVDSIMLLEENFNLTSVDLSDKMLKYALKTRWKRRKEAAFDAWVIEEANWLTLTEDIEGIETFDAVVCLGNSFAHMPDISGDGSEHKRAIENFAAMVKPGGILLIDHRNYDYIIEHGQAPSNNIYYNSNHIEGIKTSVLLQDGAAKLITLDYRMRIDTVQDTKCDTDSKTAKKGRLGNVTSGNFRLSYFPHLVKKFGSLLSEVFGPGSEHKVYGDFKPVKEAKDPAFFIHVIKKPPAKS